MSYHWNVDFHSFDGRNFVRNLNRYTRYFPVTPIANPALTCTWTSRLTHVAYMTDYLPFVVVVVADFVNSCFDYFA